MKNLKYIGVGNYGYVYETIHNNSKVVIKQFNNISDMEKERDIYIKMLSIYCGKLYIKNESVYYIKDNIEHIKLSSNIIKLDNTQIIQSDDKILLDIINNLLEDEFDTFISLKFVLSDINVIQASTEFFTYTIGNITIKIDVNNENVLSEITYYNLHIDSFKLMRILFIKDNMLYFQHLGSSLEQSFNNDCLYVGFNQRVLLCIDLLRQMSILLERGIYHNDIKNDNLTIRELDSNYYISIIDYGLAISKNKTYLDEILLTTSNAFSPEYYKIYNAYMNDIIEIKYLEKYLDYASNWIVGGIIINILCWKNVQLKCWYNHYNENKSKDNLYILKKYKNVDIAHNYIIQLIFELLSINDLYNSVDDKLKNIYDLNEKLLLNIQSNKDNLLDNLYLILNNNITYYKKEYIDLILIIFNLLEFRTDKKKKISTLYEQLKTYPSYNEYLTNRFLFC